MNEKLLAIFNRSEMTAAKLSEKSNIHKSIVSRWKNGHHKLSIDSFEKLAKALGVRVEIKGPKTKFSKSQKAVQKTTIAEIKAKIAKVVELEGKRND